MTREEALGKLGDESLERAGINGLVNDIYDYFEKWEIMSRKQIVIDLCEDDCESLLREVVYRNQTMTWMFETKDGEEIDVKFIRYVEEDIEEDKDYE